MALSIALLRFKIHKCFGNDNEFQMVTQRWWQETGILEVNIHLLYEAQMEPEPLVSHWATGWEMVPISSAVFQKEITILSPDGDTLPEGYIFTTKDAGSDDDSDSDINSTDDNKSDIVTYWKISHITKS